MHHLQMLIPYSKWVNTCFMTRVTDEEVGDVSENRYGPNVVSLISSDHKNSFLTKFMKQVVFILLGFCLLFMYFKLYLWIVFANNCHLYEFLTSSCPLPCRSSFCVLSCFVCDILQEFGMLGLSFESENKWFSSLSKCPCWCWVTKLFLLITSLILALWHLLLDEVCADGVCTDTESLVHLMNNSWGFCF